MTTKIDEAYLEDLLFNDDFETAPNGDFALVNGINNLRQALFNRLVTTKGSLAHRPNYGVGIQRYQNAPATLATQRKMALDIDEQFKQEKRVLKLVSVQVTFQDGGKFEIKYKVEGVGIGTITDTINPFGDFSL